MLQEIRFFAAPGSNFTLQSESPAKNAGIVSDVYATFQTLCGLSIAKDRNQTARPVDAWDIGAYKFSGRPSAPQNMKVLDEY